MEQEHSEEIIGFQERENSLKLNVMQAEEQLSVLANHRDLMRLVNNHFLLNSSTLPNWFSQESQQKIDQLTEQLYSTAQQKDSVSLQLSNVQEENDQLHQQVTNLQMVLEEFQKGLNITNNSTTCSSYHC